MNRHQSKPRWSVRRRFEFIEFRLYWEGKINRGHLKNTFGISVNQASTDLNNYLRLAPENMVYDKSARAYVRCPMFTPLLLKLDADRYLIHLRDVTSGIISAEDSWLNHYPDYDGPKAPTRLVNPHTLQVVLEALRAGNALNVRYQSLENPAPCWQWIAPHALASDGLRWHARAFCLRNLRFRDFLLARIIETGSMRASERSPEQDSEWQQYIDLEIGPHPALSDSQRRVIALDYGMEDERVSLRVRKALAVCTLRRLGLEDALLRNRSDQDIVLLNTEEVRRSLEEQVEPGGQLGLEEQVETEGA